METQTISEMLAIGAVCEQTNSDPAQCLTIVNPVPNIFCHENCYGYIVIHYSGSLLGQADICRSTGKVRAFNCSA